MSIIKDWYNGFLYPSEEIVPKDAEYRSVSEKCAEEMEYFKDRFQAKDSSRFVKWNGMLGELSAMQSFENFDYGFKLGILLMCEILLDENMKHGKLKGEGE